jgi:Xaa-Pro aminopeptidase
MSDIANKLQLLRTEMRRNNIDIYIIPSIDAHNSEYVPECWERRSWISGFNGSAGEVLVTHEHAYLSTDGRYFLQATNQLDSAHYTLIKQKGFVSEIDLWLLENAQDKTVGIDPELLSIDRANKLRDLLRGISAKLVFITDNLVDNCRQKLGETLKLPNGKAFVLSEAYSGESIATKLKLVRNELSNHSADFIALNVLDEIAWLFNVRGNDILYNPLVISYAIIGRSDAYLFVDEKKVDDELRSALNNSGVKLQDYNQFRKYLANLHGSIWFDEKTANYSMLDHAPADAEIVFAKSPIIMKKACKNQIEINGARSAHVKDAVAVIRFLHWLTNNWRSTVTEMSSANTLAMFRAEGDHFKGMSFNTISGFASNGAIIHYRVTQETDKTIDDTSLYLIDSGGQYLDGTTDITRTIHLGQPTKEQKKHYTLVLKGHLALGRAKFPHGTNGEHLDVLARNALWHEYLNYGHGTGHGVGSFLCVHEGPQKISPAISNTSLLPGMIVSNEPGLYIAGQYGIRIENLCLVNKDNSNNANNSEYGPFYNFEDLTLVPYAKELIDINLLDKADKEQIDIYYARIRETVRPLLGDEEQAWLDNQLDLFN